MNGNGNGHQVRAQSLDTHDARQCCYAIGPADGGLILADKHICEESNGGTVWTTVWESLPEGTTIIRVTVFQEGGGMWEPLDLGNQADAQVETVEKILNLHGLSLTAVVGKQKKWLKGGRHQ